MLKQVLLFLIFINCIYLQAQSFKATQQKCERVKTAYSEKWELLQTELAKQKIDKNSFELFIRIFKKDKIVEVWLKSKSKKEFQLFKSYKICASSGTLGPKHQQGDNQVPEGFYSVSAFNPYSNYYLSLGVSYPNESDKMKWKNNLGGDIMIHGNCVTIGCIPLTDEFIKEVYILAVEAKNGGQQTIPIHIFPTKLDEKGMTFLQNTFEKSSLIDFWKNLKTGYDYFEVHHFIPKIKADGNGTYIFQ